MRLWRGGRAVQTGGMAPSVGRVDRAGWRRDVGWKRGGSSPSSSALSQMPT